MKQRVFVGLSGGVDSSVAAALLKKQGYEVTGIHIKCFNVDGCAERDAEDARRVAETLGIPFYVFDLEDEYKERVVAYMVDGYRRGITPNPDVMCNREIKFGLFMRRALELGADYIATGHYVRLVEHENEDTTNRNLAAGGLGGFRTIASRKPRRREDKWRFPQKKPERVEERRIFALMQAKDTNKDQSYFLWTLTQKHLKHCLFPLGEYEKPTVRLMAESFNLPTAQKKDSQGICFLGQVTLTDFLRNYIPAKTGDIVNGSGAKIGAHEGAHAYTPGQRHGLKVGGMKEPMYVTKKDVITNTVTIGEKSTAIGTEEILMTDVNIIGTSTEDGTHVMARTRYRQPLFHATLRTIGDSYALIPNEPQKFVAAGQSAVWYSTTGEMLGGGVIL